jgi:hypothetical protein
VFQYIITCRRCYNDKLRDSSGKTSLHTPRFRCERRRYTPSATRPTALPATVHLSAAVYRLWDCRPSTKNQTARSAIGVRFESHDRREFDVFAADCVLDQLDQITTSHLVDLHQLDHTTVSYLVDLHRLDCPTLRGVRLSELDV